MEAALVLPLLLLVFALIVDLGRLSYDRTLVSNAARVGAGVGRKSLPEPGEEAAWEAQIQAAVQSSLEEMPGFEPGRLQVASSCISENGQPCVEVQVSYLFQTLFAWPGSGRVAPMQATVVLPISN